MEDEGARDVLALLPVEEVSHSRLFWAWYRGRSRVPRTGESPSRPCAYPNEANHGVERVQLVVVQGQRDAGLVGPKDPHVDRLVRRKLDEVVELLERCAGRGEGFGELAVGGFDEDVLLLLRSSPLIGGGTAGRTLRFSSTRAWAPPSVQSPPSAQSTRWRRRSGG